MSLFLVYADAVPTDIVDALGLTGFSWKAASSIEAANAAEPDGGWLGALLITNDPGETLNFCRVMRQRERPLHPILLVMRPELIGTIDVTDDLFDDFIAYPAHPGELETRLRHLLWRANGTVSAELVEYGSLVLNLSTYQAAVSGRPLDMTYMEYELLKHFATHPGRVLTREDLLRQVWGYEYYGGARTVDVHVRRLRAKLGDEHAALIQTVRSVGYIFGRQRAN
jgi:DNA-binding response OmpR family regulator